MWNNQIFSWKSTCPKRPREKSKYPPLIILVICSLIAQHGLEKWNVSNGKDFSYIFSGCSLLDIKELQNWNVSNGNNFRGIFCRCSSLSDIKGLENWNVSNGNNLVIYSLDAHHYQI